MAQRISRRERTQQMLIGTSAAAALLAWIFWDDVQHLVKQPTRTWLTTTGRVILPPGVKPPAPRRIYTAEELEYYGQRAAADPRFAATLPADLRKLI